jgi:hypothetical protein
MATAVETPRRAPSRRWTWWLIRCAGCLFERMLPDNTPTVSGMIRAAERFTGLSDWGDLPFEEGLAAVIESCHRDLQLKYLGRLLLQKGLLHTLVNRLCTQEECRTRPAVLQREIRRPFVVLGLPRTGTTLLHNLLSLDPHCRPLLGWEAFYPVPLRRRGKVVGDRRQADCVKYDRLFRRLVPRVAVAHDFAPNGPEECAWLLINSYLPPTLLDLGQQAYRDWQVHVSDEYLEGAYRLHRRQLQILQGAEGRRRWALKAPTHLYGLHGLLAVYPDAIAIQTHREPLAVVGSSASLISRGLPADSRWRGRVGEEVLKSLEVSWQRGMAVRRRLPAGRIIDVRYNDLLARPIEVVRAIYAAAGETCPGDMEQRVEGWLREHPQHARGKHEYSLEQFGLTQDEVEERIGRAVREFL